MKTTALDLKLKNEDADRLTRRYIYKYLVIHFFRPKWKVKFYTRTLTHTIAKTQLLANLIALKKISFTKQDGFSLWFLQYDHNVNTTIGTLK